MPYGWATRMTTDNGAMTMARLFNPPHPGLTLRDAVLPALGLTVTQAAQQLNVSRVALSRVLNGRAAISPEMALRIEAWLGVKRGGEARLWPSKAPMTCGRPNSASKPSRCTFNPRHRPPPDGYRPGAVAALRKSGRTECWSTRPA